MADVKLRWNMAGFRELRTSARVRADILRRARNVAAVAGDGYRADPSDTRNRARAAVVTDSDAAKADNARNQTLLRALDAGRR